MDVTHLSHTPLPSLAQCRPWRMNLVAFHPPNLLFIAIVDTIHVYHLPSRNTASTTTTTPPPEPFAKLPPPLHPPNHPPIPINAIQTGFLASTTPILISVNDAGYVSVFFIDSLANPGSHAATVPPISLMAPESAWGIANHAVRSLIAVSANSHTVTVFDMSLDAVVGDGSGSGGGDGAVLGEGVTRRELKGHGNNIPGIAFSGCGRFLGSASIDGTVRVWELRSGMCVGVVENRGVDERWWNWGVRFLEEGGVGFRRRRRREMEGSEWDRNLAVQTRKAFDVTYGSDGEETVCSFDGEEEDGYDEEDVVLCDSESEDEESKFMDSTEEPNNDNIFPMMSRQTSYFSATEDQVMESDEDEGGSNMWESDNSGTPPLVIPEELYLEDTDLDLHDEVDEADDWEDEDDVVDEFWGDDQDAEISDADDASIDSDYLWQRPVNQESSLDIKVLDQSRMAKFSGWILYTTLTSVWIVDLKTQTKICGIENVFKDVSFGRWKVFDRISIHEYVPELGIIILMTQAGAIAIIKLWKSVDSKKSVSVYEMELAKVIRPIEHVPYVGMMLKRHWNPVCETPSLELRAFSFDSKMSVYEIRWENNADTLSVDKLTL